jgi:hypothetical protein
MPTTEQTKIKRSFSISRNSESFLRREMKGRRSSSASQTLDELLAELQRQREGEKIDQAITAYYDSIDAQEVEGERAWGELGGRSLFEIPE